MSFAIITFELSDTVKQETGSIISATAHPIHKGVLVLRVDPSFTKLPADIASEELKLALDEYDYAQTKEASHAKPDNAHRDDRRRHR